MRHLLHIIILLAFIGSSCQEVAALSEQEVRPYECVQTETQYNGSRSTLYNEGILSSPVSMSCTFSHSEERAETRTGKRTEPSSRSGGNIFKANHAPRSAIYFFINKFSGCYTATICSFASHTSLIYVLRHIIR